MARSNEADLLSLINTAQSVGVLTSLGLTAHQARKLLEYRHTHGPFEQLEDLLKVKGISERTLAKLKLLHGSHQQGSTPKPVKAEPPSYKMAVWMGAILFPIFFFSVLTLANNGRGWFIGMAIVGSFIAGLMSIFMLQDLLGKVDSKSPRGANAIVGAGVAFGIILALIIAPTQFPVPRSSPSTSQLSGSDIAIAEESDGFGSNPSSEAAEPIATSPAPLPPCLPSKIAEYWIPLHSELAEPVKCEEIGQDRYRAVLTINFDKFLSSENWVFEFIDRFLILAEKVFTDSVLSGVYEVRVVARALYVQTTIYGERKEVWEPVLAATFPRTEAEKVVDWYECRVMYTLRPLLFFGSGLVKDVYIDPRVPLSSPSP